MSGNRMSKAQANKQQSNIKTLYIAIIGLQFSDYEYAICCSLYVNQAKFCARSILARLILQFNLFNIFFAQSTLSPDESLH